MGEKKIGDKIGTKPHTFGRKESNPNNTSAVVSVANVDGVVSDTEYFFSMKPRGNTEFPHEIEPFVRKTHKANETFSITHSMIREYNIKPGQNFYINIHEIDESKSLDEIADDVENNTPNPNESNNAGESREEKIDELYEMVSELYEAYTAANND